MFKSKFLSKMTKKSFNLLALCPTLKHRINAVQVRKVAAIVACLTVTTSFASCSNGGGDDENGNAPTGEINKELVGKWGGALSGVNYFYDFKADGTFLHRTTRNFYTGGVITSTTNFYYRGVWRETNGVVNMTKRFMVSFNTIGGDKPPTNLDWKATDDEKMRFRLGVSQDSKRYFENLEVVYVTPDGSLPDAYLRVILNEVPSWVFP